MSQGTGRVGEVLIPIRTTQAAVQSAKAPGLCGRVCPYWRMSAGIVSLIASVVAICCAIVWNAHWLCFPFGLSALASGYAVYLGYEFHQVKSLEKSNEELRGSLINLNQTNTRLRSTAREYHQENVNHKKLIEMLREEIVKLEGLREDFLLKASTHVEQIQGLLRSMGGIHLSVSENHKVFGTQLESFSKHLEELASSKTAFTTASSKAEQAMIEQTKALIEAGQKIREIFEAIQRWKDDALVKQQIEEIQELQRTIKNAREDWREAKEGLGSAKMQVKALREQISELEKIKKGFDVALDSLLEKIKLLEQERVDLNHVKEEIKRAAQVFQEYRVDHV